MTTPSILRSNLREKFGVDILIRDNPTIKETVSDMDKVEASKSKNVLGLLPKYLYSSAGLLSAGVTVLLAQIIKVPMLESLPTITSPALLAASAVSLSLSIGVPMYREYKHLQAKNDLRDVALKVNKFSREDKGYITYMSIDEFSNLRNLTFSAAMKEEYSKVLEGRSIFSNLKKVAQKMSLYEPEENVTKPSLVFKR